ncbi:MAG: putative bifunctional SAT/APS kinase [Calditrichaeota bacterium]|nr:putative bifunctional SAT/APS kinase [Calditrichota bacterium]
MEKHLIPPHGGTLVDLMVGPEREAELKRESRDWPSWDLTARQALDLELILNGALSPLTGYLTRDNYESVLDSMRLSGGTFWPWPIVLDVSEPFADTVSDSEGSAITLRDQEGVMLAVLSVTDIWHPDRDEELEKLFGADAAGEAAARDFAALTHPVYLGGKVEGVQLPIHYDFPELRATPRDLRSRLGRRGWRRTLSFDTRSPIHRPDLESTRRAARRTDTNLLLQPTVGETAKEDLDHYTRIRCYKEAATHYPHQTTILSLLPAPTRRAGVRELLLQALLRKNYGATHFMFRPNANLVNGEERELTPQRHEVERAFARYADELAIEYTPFEEVVYLADRDVFVPAEEAAGNGRAMTLSEHQVRNRLHDGREIPDWFSFPEVVAELVKTYPPRSKQGFTVFFTGLSGSGKSTVANALFAKLLQLGGRPVTLLDGDIVRKNLSSELGFSREHRDINILRIGFVASEITKNRGIAICAPIAPYDHTRGAVREMIEPLGGFVLVHVNTPLAVCETRDRKGLYAKARAGIIKEFTGISDPYEEPEDAELVIDTTDLSPEEAVHKLLLYLSNQGYIEANGMPAV